MAMQVFIPTSNGNVPFAPHPHQDELVLVLLFFAILAGIIAMESCNLICISLMAKEVKYFIKHFSAIRVSSIENSLCRSVPPSTPYFGYIFTFIYLILKTLFICLFVY